MFLVFCVKGHTKKRSQKNSEGLFKGAVVTLVFPSFTFTLLGWNLVVDGGRVPSVSL